MKHYLIFILAFLLTCSAFSQTQEECEKTLNFVKMNFNENKASLIYSKFNADFKAKTKKDQFEKIIDNLRKEKGAMQSYEFLMEDEGLKNYLVEFEKASMLILLSLKEEGVISALEIKDY